MQGQAGGVGCSEGPGLPAQEADRLAGLQVLQCAAHKVSPTPCTHARLPLHAVGAPHILASYAIGSPAGAPSSESDALSGVQAFGELGRV